PHPGLCSPHARPPPLAPRPAPGSPGRSPRGRPRSPRGRPRGIRGRDNCLIYVGYQQCYCLVIIITSAPVNRALVFSPKSRALPRPFWHCGAPAVLVRGGPDGAPGQVQRTGGAATVTARAPPPAGQYRSRPVSQQAGTVPSRRLVPGG